MKEILGMTVSRKLSQKLSFEGMLEHILIVRTGLRYSSSARRHNNDVDIS